MESIPRRWLEADLWNSAPRLTENERREKSSSALMAQSCVEAIVEAYSWEQKGRGNLPAPPPAGIWPPRSEDLWGSAQEQWAWLPKSRLCKNKEPVEEYWCCDTLVSILTASLRCARHQWCSSNTRWRINDSMKGESVVDVLYCRSLKSK